MMVLRSRVAQVFLQRFGIEEMLPNGERVSSLLTDSKRERATVSCRRAVLLRAAVQSLRGAGSQLACFHQQSLSVTPPGGREVRQLRAQRAQFLHHAGALTPDCASQCSLVPFRASPGCSEVNSLPTTSPRSSDLLMKGRRCSSSARSASECTSGWKIPFSRLLFLYRLSSNP